MERPSIAIIPSAYKTGVLAAVLPNNGIADLDFTRGSIATRVNAQGLIEEVGVNIPRLDYSDGSCPSLLLEPQSTNLITYSENFSNANWLKTQSTLTPNTIVSPDGTLNASTLTATNSFAQLTFNHTGTTSTVYTVSFWLKRKTGTGAIAIKAVENINTTVSVTNEWQRFSVTATSTSTNIISAVRLLTIGDEVYIWGAQLEQQSSATSYIPNYGTTEGITRLADTASLDLTPFNITTIIETIDGVEQPPITTIPTIYNAPIGRVNKILMY